MITYSRGVTMVLNRAKRNGFDVEVRSGSGEIERTIKLTTGYRDDLGVWRAGTNGKVTVPVDSIAVHLLRDGLRQVGVWGPPDEFVIGRAWVPCRDPDCPRAGVAHPDDSPWVCGATSLGTVLDLIELRAQARELEAS